MVALPFPPAASPKAAQAVQTRPLRPVPSVGPTRRLRLELTWRIAGAELVAEDRGHQLRVASEGGGFRAYLNRRRRAPVFGSAEAAQCWLEQVMREEPPSLQLAWRRDGASLVLASAWVDRAVRIVRAGRWYQVCGLLDEQSGFETVGLAKRFCAWQLQGLLGFRVRP